MSRVAAAAVLTAGEAKSLVEDLRKQGRKPKSHEKVIRVEDEAVRVHVVMADEETGS